LQHELQQSINSNYPTIIEIQTDGAIDQQQQQTLTQQILNAMP
jgi:2-succinyl-5-enolpyruvyl-6-hydroxy-3-cyclohexene-1-carboxylate synthase